MNPAGHRTRYTVHCLRGQAAVEYLTTYGWAVLALVIIVGIIISSGIFSPSYLVSEECSLSSTLPCQFALVNSGGQTTLSVGIYNGFPYKIKITAVKVYAVSDNKQFSGFETNVPPIESGDNFVFHGSLGSELPANTVAKFYANVTYESCAPEVATTPDGCSGSPHTISGKITGRVLAGQ